MTLSEYKKIIHQHNRPARLEQMKRFYQANKQGIIKYQRDYRLRKKNETEQSASHKS